MDGDGCSADCLDFDAWAPACELAFAGPACGLVEPVEHLAFLNKTHALLLSRDGLYCLLAAQGRRELLVRKAFAATAATLWEGRVLYMFAVGGDGRDEIHAAYWPDWDRLSRVYEGSQPEGAAPRAGLFYASPSLSPGTLWLVVGEPASIRVVVLFPAHTWALFQRRAIAPPRAGHAMRPLQAVLGASSDLYAGPWVLTVAFDCGAVYTLSADRLTDELVDPASADLADAFFARVTHIRLASPHGQPDEFAWHPERRGGGPVPAEIGPLPKSHFLSRWFLSVSQRGTHPAFDPQPARRGVPRALGVGSVLFVGLLAADRDPTGFLDAPACYDVLEPFRQGSEAPTLRQLLGGCDLGGSVADVAGRLAAAVESACGAFEPTSADVHPATGALWLARGARLYEVSRTGVLEVVVEQTVATRRRCAPSSLGVCAPGQRAAPGGPCGSTRGGALEWSAARLEWGTQPPLPCEAFQPALFARIASAVECTADGRAQVRVLPGDDPAAAIRGLLELQSATSSWRFTVSPYLVYGAGSGLPRELVPLLFILLALATRCAR